ncbi:hypothetical protein AB4305_05720 [Nocardia sp. 2YAB30]|uniref:hypothetical protein n=1 Tax=unclassified Nocardia TaxID=2637762 RepID=UPI003F95D429
MTTVTTALILASFGFLSYRFASRRDERAFRLEGFRPRTPMSERTLSYYDEQRRYADLVAIYGRGDVPDADLGIGEDRVVDVPPASAPIVSARPTRKTGVPAGVSAVSALARPRHRC